jgi:hypothetical protein
MDMRDPFGIRRDFDAMLDRLEAAVTGHNPHYAFMENQADFAITRQFMQMCWDDLTHAEQHRYAGRLAYLKSRSKGQTT